MTKYSDEFKLKIVKEYLDGPLGYKLLAKKNNKPSESNIRSWVKAYQAFGLEGLQKKRSKQIYSVQFKLDVLNFLETTGASYQDTANVFI